MAKAFLKQCELLFKKGKVDLSAAKLMMHSFQSGNSELDLEIIMFHLQQSAEKFIKSILDYNNVKFPHSHDIEELLDLCKLKKISLIGNIEDFIKLTGFAVHGRYAMIHDDIYDVEQYIIKLDSFQQFIEKLYAN